jgi:hypothetical protein
MAMTVDYLTKIISVPKTDLQLISGTLYELDTNQFKKDLAALQDDEAGMPFPDMFQHNTEVTVAGTTFARTIEIINGYSIEFEDGQYSVRLAGSNNNIFDVASGILVQNQVQIIATNSAGLVVSGTAPSQQQIRDAMELDTTSGKDSVDSKLDNNFAISAAGL